MLTWRPRFSRARANERSDPSSCFENAGSLEVGVDARHGVGVDPQVDRQLPDRGELVARIQASGRDRCPQGPIELGVNRG